MANNKVKFLRGTSAEYASVVKDKDIIYFTTDDNKLYIGDQEISGNSSSSSLIHYGTLEYWNSQIELIGQKSHIYIYSNYTTIEQDGENIEVPNIKIGDGQSYLIDNPFITTSIEELLNSHISDNIKHITENERTFWNNKVSCYLNEENIIFTNK